MRKRHSVNLDAARRLKNARLEAKYSQTELANLVGVAQETISRLETGVLSIDSASARLVASLSRELSIDIYDLVS